MSIRDVITIDESLCDGCGACIPSCAEGALALVDGKARLVDDRHCDGLGACLGECPRGAISVVRREAQEFVGPVPGAPASDAEPACPGSRPMTFVPIGLTPDGTKGTSAPTRLGQWPVQLHLLTPAAPFLAGADLLLAADCAAFAAGDFHERFLRGRALAIACPKLDSRQESYVEKLAGMIDHAGVRSLTIVIMEVPCCGGLVRLVQAAAAQAERQIPVTVIVLGTRGDVLAEQRVA